MTRRKDLRKKAWIVTCLTACALAVWVASVFTYARYTGQSTVLHFGEGVVAVFPPVARQVRGWSFDYVGWSIGWRYMHWTPGIPAFPRASFSLPLWFPLLVMLFPTAHAWRRYRMARRGRCWNCEYDLTGNVSGVCPECGERHPR